MTKWLYRYEIKGIQSFVLATGRLREIAGASALIEQLPGRLEQAVPTGRVLMQAAGAATLKFTSDQELRDFAEWWPMAVDTMLPGVEVVQAWVDEEESGSLELLAKALRAERNLRLPDLPEAGPLVERSGRTGRPAVGRDGKKGGLVDRSTRAKLRAAKNVRSLLRERLLPEDHERTRFVQNHELFGDETIAVIHIDGNDMGKRVLGKKWDARSYAAFSSAVSATTLSAARKAVGELVNRFERPDEILARPVVLGGDDFTMITLARHALDFIRDYLTEFELASERKRELLGGSRLTACAGAAFIKPGAPFHEGYRLSEELCAHAKTRLRERGKQGETPSGLMFHRVTSPMIATLREISETELAATSSPPTGPPTRVPWALSFGPYTLDRQAGFASVEQLEGLLAATRRMPRGAVREWLRAAQGDPERADVLWLRLGEVARERDKTVWSDFAGLLNELGVSTENGWADRITTIRRTPLYDVLAWSMVAGRDGQV